MDSQKKIHQKTLRKASYLMEDDQDVFHLISVMREGVDPEYFSTLVESSPFNMQEWSTYLHLSERTLHRYKKENRAFDPPQSERIIQIVLLYQLGIKVFGNTEKFNTWLNTKSIALAQVQPKTLLDSSFGIQWLRDELVRIEHGVLA